jgi:LysR family transcriptional regulator, glycine cleavage system transcriptional activator
VGQGASTSGRLPPFAALRAFDATFRCGGIRKAAVELGLNHAVVSRHIRQLEDWVGLPLVARAGNRLALTEDGTRYHARIAASFADIARATDEIVGRRDHAPLRICCIPGFATQWLAAELARFERDFPGHEVELKPTERMANLSLHEADVDIRFYRDDRDPPGGRGLLSYELARPELLPLASPALAARLARDADVTHWPFIHDDDDSEWRYWFLLNGATVPPALPGLLCWHSNLAVAAAREGRGVVLASRFLVDDDIREGRLVEVVVPGLRPDVVGRYALVAREDRWSNPALVRLRQFLRARATALLAGSG